MGELYRACTPTHASLSLFLSLSLSLSPPLSLSPSPSLSLSPLSQSLSLCLCLPPSLHSELLAHVSNVVNKFWTGEWALKYCRQWSLNCSITRTSEDMLSVYTTLLCQCFVQNANAMLLKSWWDVQPIVHSSGTSSMIARIAWSVILYLKYMCASINIFSEAKILVLNYCRLGWSVWSCISRIIFWWNFQTIFVSILLKLQNFSKQLWSSGNCPPPLT